MSARIGLVWAEAAHGVIGAEGGMPWHVPEDLAHFKAVTLGAPVIMGRRTWDSLPEHFRPLSGRSNIVVTRNAAWSADGAETASSLDDALTSAERDSPEWVWVIGGGGLFVESIARASRLEVTELNLEVAGDTFAPERGGWSVSAADPADGWHLSSRGVSYRFLTFLREEGGRK
ncbi:dihydrofolate reductase (plasmid) [Coraliomargarita sp. W4R53]